MTKVVIGSDHLGREFIDELEGLHPEVEFVAAYEEPEQQAAAADADVFFGWPSLASFRAARQLKWMACPGTGVDKIVAIPEIVESGIPLTNAPGAHVVPMAEHVLGMMVSLAHNYRQLFREQDEKIFDQGRWESRIIELRGRTMGIFSLGEIGRAVARRASAFEMRVLAVDPHPAEVPDAVSECRGLDGLDDLMREADWLVISAPLIPATRGIIDARRLALMKPGSYVVIISRGGIVEEQALADALASGHLAGAGIDATEVEPLPQDSPLWDLENVMLTQHASALSPELYEGRRQVFKDNLARFLNGEPLRHVCDKSAGY
ncbi:MAG: D-2-hydroxyacid dehydrogenase [Chloroflexi bacterium]|nr:D-2-hydroxyacid dehydrogenase [Chloroflexota bacterium]